MVRGIRRDRQHGHSCYRCGRWGADTEANLSRGDKSHRWTFHRTSNLRVDAACGQCGQTLEWRTRLMEALIPDLIRLAQIEVYFGHD